MLAEGDTGFLAVHGVEKSFGQRKVVKGASLYVDRGEAVGLLDRCDHIQLVLNAVSFAQGAQRFGSYYGQEDSK